MVGLCDGKQVRLNLLHVFMDLGSLGSRSDIRLHDLDLMVMAKGDCRQIVGVTDLVHSSLRRAAVMTTGIASKSSTSTRLAGLNPLLVVNGELSGLAAVITVSIRPCKG